MGSCWIRLGKRKNIKFNKSILSNKSKINSYLFCNRNHMGAKNNTKEFILKAKKVHGYRYDYSKVDYVKSSLKVIIICKLHGEFLQTPANHLRGSGCPICSKNIKYTKEVCLEEAQKYSSRGEFRKNSQPIYDAACSKNWLDEICSHMPGKIKKKADWWNNIERCKATASLYTSLEELKNAESGCYASISKHKWQDICYKHMNYRQREYTEQHLVKLAKECKTHKEFRTKYPGAYSSAKNKNILDKICQHMPPLKKNTKSSMPLTFENCKKIANNFETRSDFQKFDNGRWYQYAQRNNILNEICSHMLRKGNKKKRCIYAAEFDDNSAYIGLTYFAERRWSNHLRAKDSAVNKHIEETGLTPKWKKLTDYVDYQEASKLEGDWKDNYAKEGWTILNKAKTGSLGGNAGYTLEEVLKEASKYNSLPEFFKGSPGHYQRAYRNGWMKDVKHICNPKWRGGFTEEELREIFSKFNNITELRKHRHAAIDAAYKLGIIEELTKDYIVKPKKRYIVERFTEQELHDIAKRYKYRSEFKNINPKAYHNAKRKGILDKVCAHMKKKSPARIEMTENEIRIEALKYEKRSDFLKHARIAAERARELGIYEVVCAHMKNAHWKYTKEEAIEIAKQFRNRTELLNANKAAYKRLASYKLLDSILPIGEAYNYKWTDEARRKAAAQCKSRTEFKKKYPWAHTLASQNKGELDAICSHMPKPNRWTNELLIELASQCLNMEELKELNFKAYMHVTHTKGKSSLVKEHFNKDKNTGI